MSRLINFCILVILVLSISSCGEKNNKWEKYVSKDGGFSIYMPTPVKRSDKMEVTAFGKQMTHFITWKPSSFAIAKFKLFQVSYTDCPARFSIDSLRRSAILDSSINLRKADFTELKDIEAYPIELNGYQGRCFIYQEINGNTIVIVKQCIVNNKRYDVTVVAKKDYPTNLEISNFFNSFTVLK